MKCIRESAKRVTGGSEYIENTIIPMIDDLHRCPTKTAFQKLSTAALSKWRNDRENEFAAYFEDFFLHEKWTHWYAGSMPITGIGFTNDPLEAANRKIKTIVRCLF